MSIRTNPLARMWRLVGMLACAAAVLALCSCFLFGTSGQPAEISLRGTLGPGGGHEEMQFFVGPGQLTFLLLGSVEMTDGFIQVRLTPPHTADVYNETFGLGLTSISEQFDHAAEGTWTLSVDSTFGTGQYDLSVTR